MRDGFVRVAAGTPCVRVADCPHNAGEIIALMRAAQGQGAKLLVLPELCVTGYTAGDLFLQRALLDGALSALARIAAASEGGDLLCCLGLPLAVRGRLYNCAAVIQDGRVLGVVPKRHPPNYAVHYELRHFAPGEAAMGEIELLGRRVPFGGELLFECQSLPELRLGVEICEDLWVPNAPSIRHALAGATVIANLSASDEAVGKGDYRALLMRSQSARLLCGYLYANAGPGESSTDLVYAAHNFIAENGWILAESARYECGLIATELDVHLLDAERRRVSTFGRKDGAYVRVPFELALSDTALTRPVDPRPFVPAEPAERARRCEEIFNIQVQGLMQRLRHTGLRCAVLGVSGGLDSTLALLVTARAFEKLGLPAQGILAVSMPGFGTTDRTRNNARRLAEHLGLHFLEIPIAEAVRVHFRDIGHDPDAHDIVYENSQARERTQVLMDLANKHHGLVVGTGDLSELALGWATYNGDHMSMYAVNASVPKTLVRYLVRHAAEQVDLAALREVLLDVLDTPVSPELLPPVDGHIAQRTEELVGPYELHDFFLYHALRRAEPPRKVLRLARIAFQGQYEPQTIAHWLKTFYRRFFSQQFKRSCLPDGPKVGSVSLSPRGDLRMPSDASGALWTDAALE